MMFGIALLLAVVVPLALTAFAYERAKREPQPIPVTQWRRASPRPRRPRDPGYTWGVGIGIVAPYAVAGILHLVEEPDGTGGLLFLGTILTCWAIHFFTRHRTSFFGAIPWGMVLGSFVLPCAVGLVLVPVLAAFGL
ncbi:hypothetical protein GCM10011584_19950 [Nocardioides phosphati]|uniref:Uncharacterized protein n=2 Tax=Nocardioides phosphati TaxID=1867775 RepID=A0ABQ2NBH6_9ACTN|nr:hypothetical protein GCM10011584_19950 [Nocardioides phosphati]